MKRIIQGGIGDIPRIMDCAREFTRIIPNCPLDEAHYGAWWERILLSGLGAMFLLEDGGEVVGGIGGLLYQEPLTGFKSAAEVFWYVKPGHRCGTWPVRLFKAYERWAKQHVCVTVTSGHTAYFVNNTERMKEFYERRGYAAHEMNYRKRL